MYVYRRSDPLQGFLIIFFTNGINTAFIKNTLNKYSTDCYHYKKNKLYMYHNYIFHVVKYILQIYI